MEYKDLHSSSNKPLKDKLPLEKGKDLPDDGQVSFREELLGMIQRYLARRLSMAYHTGALSKRLIPPKEILNLVYVELYTMIEGGMPKRDELKVLLFQVTDRVLEKEIAELDFERRHFIGLQQLEHMELADLEEKFTIDAEGKLVMVEELDDPANPAKYYGVESVIPEDHDTLADIEKPLMEYDKRQLHRMIKRQLLTLPENERTIFDLFWLEGLEINHIAKIRKCSPNHIRKILEEVTLKVKTSLEKRWKK